MDQEVDIIAEYQGGASIPDIAELSGIPRSTVRCRLIKAGVELRSRADGVRLSAHKIGDVHRGKTREFTPEWCANISKGRLAWGDEHAAGVSLKPSGYIEYTRGPHKGRLVHDVVMEERIGRRLKPDEIVHHIDEVKTNNDEDNLALMTRAAHQRLHQRERRLIKESREWQAA